VTWISAGLQARSMETFSQRLPFIREVSAGDSDLRRQVESLLADDHRSGVLVFPLVR